VIGELKDMGGMNAMPGAKSGHAFHRCGAGDPMAKEEIQNAGVDGNAVVLGCVAQVDSHFHSLACGKHGRSFRAGRPAGNTIRATRD